MTMSLDGYINDRNGSVEKLYADFSEMHDVSSFQKMIKNTGAVVPIFVITHTPPLKRPKENKKLTFTFVTDGIESAISQAKKAAGRNDVQIVGGASTFQQSLNSGLCDELSLDIVPILLGGGLRFFENINTDKIKLEKIKVEETTPTRTSFILKVSIFR